MLGYDNTIGDREHYRSGAGIGNTLNMAGMHRFPSIILCFLLIALALSALQSPALRPIGKRGLLDALKIGGLTAVELVRKIKERGVSFEITPDVEDKLRKAGAPSEVIQAARDNYKGVTLAPGVRAPVRPSNRPSSSKPGGTPTCSKKSRYPA